jgi:transcriptional regulator with XRE-family HTH domain
MAREEIQVNPDLIAWAREHAGLTLEEASKKFNRIAAWEAGDASPTYLQLERACGQAEAAGRGILFPRAAESSADPGVVPHLARCRI